MKYKLDLYEWLWIIGFAFVMYLLFTGNSPTT